MPVEIGCNMRALHGSHFHDAQAEVVAASSKRAAKIYACCAALNLEYRFANTHAMLCLHVWLALVRLRAEGKDGKDLAQMMYENFQEDVELRVRAEGVKVRRVACAASCGHFANVEGTHFACMVWLLGLLSAFGFCACKVRVGKWLTELEKNFYAAACPMIRCEEGLCSC